MVWKEMHTRHCVSEWKRAEVHWRQRLGGGGRRLLRNLSHEEGRDGGSQKGTWTHPGVAGVGGVLSRMLTSVYQPPLLRKTSSKNPAGFCDVSPCTCLTPSAGCGSPGEEPLCRGHGCLDALSPTCSSNSHVKPQIESRKMPWLARK